MIVMGSLVVVLITLLVMCWFGYVRWFALLFVVAVVF